MIYGIGTDIADVRRFAKWVENPDLISRFFNKREIKTSGSRQKLQEHYASRFAVKEAFSKALGTGVSGFELADVYVGHNEEGKPELCLERRAASLVEMRCGKTVRISVSLSHEKEYTVAFVVIEV
ncbi:holo-ACP synthase [Treponema socranskii]|uniref:Holo-[acyl-carrier-protein] synthase n=1 Tax=Treponema socranskii subsp. socranskii VPI DR56BR1116 = ATCC 35536 TaxID=1125725 RepID=U2L270_TRESO|nr:holo-ACP synthase [Treponema socranskii]ERF61814.1 holo-[acyl-carrier-protein] synthase [Treponema socranskii subsp. socranskii VPI DR56BR1116 = ATCC 35536]ERJ98607.1 holo-[acyl-carrier-protein] synthase [Treponema socranskii subsp. socranskii VPI DR56BR1116 = ATCC 35536]MDR9859074.1 holo-ACP synthase [Treponema socranskii]